MYHAKFIQKYSHVIKLIGLIFLANLSSFAFSGERDQKKDTRRHSPTQELQSLEEVNQRERDRKRNTATNNDRTNNDRNSNSGAQINNFRSIDGSGNNLNELEWGRVDTAFLRLSFADYEDGVSQPSGSNRPNPRAISNTVVSQTSSTTNYLNASDYVWLWGQFVDHDIDLTPTITPVEPFDIAVPAGDIFFDPQNTNNVSIPLDRSLYEVVDGQREQLNVITAWIDASNVYGSDLATQNLLRLGDGSGRLRTSQGNLLPFNPENPNEFIAGDERANEHAGLAAMHTLFMREHNFWAGKIRRENPNLNGETLYQKARKIVAAEIQWITFNEFLPIILGPDAIPSYRGYNDRINPAISNEFATASYRFGHSMVSPQLLRLNRNNESISRGPLPLRDAFFDSTNVISSGIDPLLRGLAQQPAQAVDIHIVDDLRNFLFGPPGAGGFDLASLNIQRGRDHGLPPYNDVRQSIGLPEIQSFSDITANNDVQQRLSSVYPNVDTIDLWVGGLAEDPVPGGLVGETVQHIVAEQFQRLRDGDRFWYENDLTSDEINHIESQTLAKIIRRNTNIGDELPDNVFVVPNETPGNNGAGDGNSDTTRNRDRDRKSRR